MLEAQSFHWCAAIFLPDCVRLPFPLSPSPSLSFALSASRQERTGSDSASLLPLPLPSTISLPLTQRVVWTLLSCRALSPPQTSLTHGRKKLPRRNSAPARQSEQNGLFLAGVSLFLASLSAFLPVANLSFPRSILLALSFSLNSAIIEQKMYGGEAADEK